MLHPGTHRRRLIAARPGPCLPRRSRRQLVVVRRPRRLWWEMYLAPLSRCHYDSSRGYRPGLSSLRAASEPGLNCAAGLEGPLTAPPGWAAYALLGGLARDRLTESCRRRAQKRRRSAQAASVSSRGWQAVCNHEGSVMTCCRARWRPALTRSTWLSACRCQCRWLASTFPVQGLHSSSCTQVVGPRRVGGPGGTLTRRLGSL